MYADIEPCPVALGICTGTFPEKGPDDPEMVLSREYVAVTVLPQYSEGTMYVLMSFPQGTELTVPGPIVLVLSEKGVNDNSGTEISQ